MSATKALEKQWLRNFRKSLLVDGDSKRFRGDIARQLYYRRTDEDYPPELPSDFEGVFQNYTSLSQDQVIKTCLKFLGAVGIKIKPQRVYEHLGRYPGDLSKLVQKTHYILKTLADRAGSIDPQVPFRDNEADIFFLARIGSGDSVSQFQLNMFQDLEIPELHRRLSSLPPNYEEQKEVAEMFRLIEDTNESFFISGKAGTGKSTFVHFLAQKTQKKVLLTAFTGIAALNVHGQTLHSFFQLPLKPLAPGDHEIKVFSEFSERRKIIERVKMIIIDEVSMLRADVLEAVDYSLRANGGDPDKPFGGKQMIFVGDLFQLPPVQNQHEETEGGILKEMYESPYFFSAPAYKSLNPRILQLTFSHRQAQDSRFTGLLDRIRLCDADEETLALINSRYMSDFEPAENEFVIRVTTTNAAARKINETMLAALPGTEISFDAEILGEGPETARPAEEVLKLKRGAQVMFVKNDPQKRWVNGTVGIVEFISDDAVEVRTRGDQVFKVGRERWENRVYKFDRSLRRITTDVIGTFEQFPLKLAWAITIHKSQGLTFDKVIIDLGEGAFVNGQAYTALSRCRSLDGIVLKSKLRKEDLILDRRLVEFYSRVNEHSPC